MEGVVNNVRVDGELPKDINGTFYRNGPNPQFVPLGRYSSWYDGDGMVHGFHFRNGRVDYVNRWVRTERFQLERTAGRALFGTLYEPGVGDPTVSMVSPNTANATIVCHGDKVLATWETGLPHELDPDSLETRGLWDFEGLVPHDMMVHPKIDPNSGDMHFFGRSAPHPLPGTTTYHVVNAEGIVIHTSEITTPYDSMTHDMFMTENFVILGVYPVCYDVKRAAAGGPYMAWEHDRSAFLGVIPKFGTDVRWIEFKGCFGSHTLNAFEDGSTIVCDTIRYERNMLFPDADGSWDFKPTPPGVYRWRVDTAQSNIETLSFDDRTMSEMPNIDPRYCGKSYRHGFTAGFIQPGTNFDALFHYDWQTGMVVHYAPGPGRYPHEPVFVPRGPTGSEGDGYLLSIVYDQNENRSDVIVLEALDIEAGPVATIKLPHRTGPGLHGTWRPA